jgi:uncharacterized membrane protein YkvA (DUF1232 family)
MSQALGKWRQKAEQLKTEVHALYLACKDPRTPWYAKAVIACVVGYALSPVDLIPDFIPILGYVDDLVLIPAGIALAIRMIPPFVMADCRKRAHQSGGEKKRRHRLAAGVILAIWLAAAIAAIMLATNILGRP